MSEESELVPVSTIETAEAINNDLTTRQLHTDF